MTKKLEFEVTFNKTVSPDPSNVQAYIEGLNSLEGKGKVTWELYGKDKSNSQNRYFHGILIPYFREGLENAGYNEIRTNEDAKAVIKHLFFKKESLHLGGTKTEIQRFYSTSNKVWGTKAWEEKMEQIRLWSIDKLGWDIPPPNEESFN